MDTSKQIISFERLLKTYGNPPIPKIKNGVIINKETEHSKTLRENVLRLTTQHKEILLQLEETMVKYNQQLIKDFPPIGLMILKRKTNRDEHEYLSARVMYPLINDTTKDIRIHLGKKTNYPNYLNDVEQQKKIQNILRKKLKTKLFFQ